MPELKNTSFKLLDWYKSIGIDICVQNSPRKRFKSNKINNKENIYPDKINNLLKRWWPVSHPPLWDGKASERISEELLK